MSEARINYLLDKYKHKHPAEIWSKEALKQQRIESLINERIDWTQSHLKATPYQRMMLEYLIQEFTNLKSLHKQASTETILTSLWFILKKLEKSNVRVTDYRVCTLYDVTPETVNLISMRLFHHFYHKNAPVPTYSDFNVTYNRVSK